MYNLLDCEYDAILDTETNSCSTEPVASVIKIYNGN